MELDFTSHAEAGLWLHKHGRLNEAAEQLKLAVGHDPKDVGSLWRLGVCFASSGEHEAAHAVAVRALALDDRCHQALCLIGALAGKAGEHAEAERLLDRALQIAPNMPSACWNKAHLAGIRGDYKTAFELFRFGVPAKQRWGRCVGKEWDGKDTGVLFVWGEQGAGDAIMFSRYLKEAKKRCKTLVFEVQRPLVPLFSVQDDLGPDFVTAQNEDAHTTAEFDAQISLMDLPWLFGVEGPDDVDGAAYLKAPEIDLQDPMNGRKTGIVWRGSPGHDNDAARSWPEADLQPLKGLPLASFQQEKTLFDWPHVKTSDFCQTAALLTKLDLLVTCDTGIAHLAGALGVPVWMTTPLNGEWRWGQEGDRTCWYDSMRVLRPEGSFRPTLESVAREIKNGSYPKAEAVLQGHGRPLQADPVVGLERGAEATGVQPDGPYLGACVPHPDDPVPQH